MFRIIVALLLFSALVIQCVICIDQRRPLPPLPGTIPFLYVGDKLPEMRWQNREYETSPSTNHQPLPFYALKLSVHKHLTKHACAFLNGPLYRPIVVDRSVVTFGVQDDGTVDGYHVNGKEMEEISQQINTLLTMIDESFEYDVSWKPVHVIDGRQNAFILSVSVWSSPRPKTVFAVQQGNAYAFWIRKNTMTVSMSYKDIQEAFAQVNSID